MLTDRDIKDKRIELCGVVYVASVHLWDGQVISAGRHAGLSGAQRMLAKFPSDVFEGHDNPAGEYATAVEDAKTEIKRRDSYEKNQIRLLLQSIAKPDPSPYERLYDRRCRENS
jgi:hypothetical protein